MTFPFPLLPIKTIPVPVVTFLGANPSGVSIGAARADRMIVTIAVMENDGANAYGGGITYNGAAATIIRNPTLSDWIGMNYLFVPTGTTLTTAGNYQICMAWMITGLTNGLYSSGEGSTGASAYSVTRTTPASPSIAIAGARSRNSASSGGVTPGSGLTGLVSDYFANHGGGGNPATTGAHGTCLGTGANAVYSVDMNSYSSGYGVDAVFY